MIVFQLSFTDCVNSSPVFFGKITELKSKEKIKMVDQFEICLVIKILTRIQ